MDVAQSFALIYNVGVIAFLHFIQPCRPIPAKVVPAGEGWLHEAKFDGYRAQLHKVGSGVEIFSKQGQIFTSRFRTIADLLRAVPVKSVIIDAEIVANNRAGFPDFFSLHTSSADPGAMNVWAFDLLMLNGRDLREQSLEKRKARLHALVERSDCPGVLASATFDDGQALLRAVEAHRLEGVVSKRRAAPYRSGPSRDWLKVKTEAWCVANRQRWRLFEKGAR